jgi:protein disulfide-isomerase A1
MKTTFLLFALLGLAVADGFWGVEEDGDVAVLTNDNFDDFLKANTRVFVKFYAPWCGHCKAMIPAYTELAQYFKGVEGDEHVAIAKVDATVHNELATKFGVQGFPTLKLFVNGEPIDYSSGARDKDAMLSWLKKKAGPASTLVDSADGLAAAQAENVAVLLLVPEGEEDSLKSFFGVAHGFESVPFYHTHDATLVSELGLTEPYGMALFRNFDDGHKYLTGVSMLSADNMKGFINAHRFPLVMEFEQEAAERIFGSESSAMFFFSEDFDVEGVANFREVAKANQGKLVFSISKVSSGLGARLAEFIGVTAADAPTARIVKFENQALQKFVVNDTSVDGMNAAVASWENGELEQYHKSEPVPEKNDEPVKVIVGNSFEDLVLKSDQHVLFEAYAPWCGHCKKLAPIYDELAQKVASSPEVLIAKMDATANEYPGLEIKGFPTLLFYKKGDKSNPMPYEGERTLEGMLKFLEEQTGLSLSGAVDTDL